MKKFVSKYRREIIMFLSAFLIYFILGIAFSYYLGFYKYWNIAFDMDSPRVFGDLAFVNYNHYRTSVHPLFVILFQPIILVMNFVVRNKIICVLLLQCFMASISVVAFSSVIKKIGIKSKLNNVLTLLFGLSFGQIAFVSNVETYIFAQTFLILLWLFVSYKIDKKLKYWDYIILVLLGIGSLAVTITNFVQFVIALFFLIFLNKKEEHRFLNCVFILFVVVSLSILFADVQQIIWPSAPNFFVKNITDFLYGSSEEALYMNFGISIRKILNVVNSSFGYSFNFGKYIFLEKGGYLSFDKFIITDLISVLLFISFLVYNFLFIRKTWKLKSEHKFYYAILFVFLVNFGLHLIYGNNIAFLYICHYNFIVILLFAYILSYYKKNDIVNNKVYYALIILIVLSSLRSVLSMFLMLLPRFNPIVDFSIKPIFIIFVLASLLVVLVFKKVFIKLLFVVCFGVLSIISYKGLNYQNLCYGCDEYEMYEYSFKTYVKQLKEMKNSFSVFTYSDVDEPLGVFFFGMADRRKMVYKAGKLMDARTQEVLLELDYRDELIVPNEYTVVLRDDDNNLYKIVEDEAGVFLYTNGEKKLLSSGNKKINLPEFDGYAYSEVLKVLHQEILFNIDGDVPKPNIFWYNTAWYRDTMLATMVFEQTDNTSLLENWVMSIDKIYDNSRDANINEADNLGELLYIIGAVGVDRSDLIDDILLEIDRLKDSDKSIGGMVDGSIQKYYPTVLALYGAEKNNIELDLVPPSVDDGYAKLTWWYKSPISTNIVQNSEYYPYINWGFYHYSGYGKLYALDEIYPLTYEVGNTERTEKVDNECFISEYYCSRKLFLSHIWSASEIFLFLINY